jgi:hypothetical protein
MGWDVQFTADEKVEFAFVGFSKPDPAKDQANAGSGSAPPKRLGYTYSTTTDTVSFNLALALPNTSTAYIAGLCTQSHSTDSHAAFWPPNAVAYPESATHWTARSATASGAGGARTNSNPLFHLNADRKVVFNEAEAEATSELLQTVNLPHRVQSLIQTVNFPLPQQSGSVTQHFCNESVRHSSFSAAANADRCMRVGVWSVHSPVSVRARSLCGYDFSTAPAPVCRHTQFLCSGPSELVSVLSAPHLLPPVLAELVASYALPEDPEPEAALQDGAAFTTRRPAPPDLRLPDD